MEKKKFIKNGSITLPIIIGGCVLLLAAPMHAVAQTGSGVSSKTIPCIVGKQTTTMAGGCSITLMQPGNDVNAPTVPFAGASTWLMGPSTITYQGVSYCVGELSVTLGGSKSLGIIIVKDGDVLTANSAKSPTALCVANASGTFKCVEAGNNTIVNPYALNNFQNVSYSVLCPTNLTACTAGDSGSWTGCM